MIATSLYVPTIVSLSLAVVISIRNTYQKGSLKPVFYIFFFSIGCNGWIVEYAKRSIIFLLS
jgi:hypothetical protein